MFTFPLQFLALLYHSKIKTPRITISVMMPIFGINCSGTLWLFLSLSLLFPPFVHILVFPQLVQNFANFPILRKVLPKAEEN